MTGVQISADEYLKHCIGRILNRDALPVGVGFLVSRRRVVTCSHVIIKALGISDDSTLPSEPIGIDFPLLNSGKKIFTGKVIKWYNSSQTDNNSDIAVIRLNQALPQRFYKAILVTSQSLLNHTFLSFGFPEEYSDGVWAQGKIIAKHAGNWIQVESTQVTGHQIQPGFSGSPVWDEALRGIVGMVVAAETDIETRGAYIIPSDVLGSRIDVQVIKVSSSDKVNLGRLEIEDSILQRRAFKLGFNLSLLTRFQMQNPSGMDDEKKAVADHLSSYCNDHSNFLDVEWQGLTLKTNDATKIAITYADEANRLTEQIESKNDKKTASTFELAFKIGLAPEYLYALQSWQKKEELRVYAKLISISKLPINFLDEIGTAIEINPNRDLLSQVAFRFEERVINFLDQRLSDSHWIKEIYRNIWEFGANVTLTALGYDAGLDLNGIKETAQKAQFYADELDLVIPSLPKRTEGMAKTEFTAIILHYLLNDIGDELSGILEERYGSKSLAYFELAIKSLLLILLYSPGDNLTNSIYTVIKDRVHECNLPEDVYMALVDCIEAASPFEAIKSEVFTFQERVSEYLA